MADDVELVSTVEWGATPPERQTWMDRLATGSAAVSPAPRASRFRPSYVALGLGIVGFLLAAAAEYLPWLIFTDTSSLSRSLVSGSVGDSGQELHLSGLPTSGAMLYGASLIIGLGLLGVLLFTEANRRLLAAAAIGVFAGNALALINLSTSMDAFGALGSNVGGPTGHLTTGFYVGVGAVAVLVAATFVAAVARPQRRTDEFASRSDADGDEPIDLTVTGLGTDIG